MKQTIATIFDRVMGRLFCGSECWEIQYTAECDTGTIAGVHRTYQALSKATTADAQQIGEAVASEIRQALYFRGHCAVMVRIGQGRRVW